MTRTILFMREPYERVALQLEGNSVHFSAVKWQQQQSGTESFPDQQKARDRFDEMCMIIMTDYGFSIFMQNIDE